MGELLPVSRVRGIRGKASGLDVGKASGLDVNVISGLGLYPLYADAHPTLVRLVSALSYYAYPMVGRKSRSSSTSSDADNYYRWSVLSYGDDRQGFIIGRVTLDYDIIDCMEW